MDLGFLLPWVGRRSIEQNELELRRTDGRRTGNTGFGECEEEGNKCASLDDSQKVSEKMDKIIALAEH